MGHTQDESGDIELLVPEASFEYACSLLGGRPSSSRCIEARTGGFPVLIAELPEGDSEIPFAHPVGAKLTRGQTLLYNVFLVILWVVCIFVLMLPVWAVLAPFYS